MCRRHVVRKQKEESKRKITSINDIMKAYSYIFQKNDNKESEQLQSTIELMRISSQDVGFGLGDET